METNAEHIVDYVDVDARWDALQKSPDYVARRRMHDIHDDKLDSNEPWAAQAIGVIFGEHLKQQARKKQFSDLSAVHGWQFMS